MAAMKFRTGVVVGFAAGYVMGSRAGRERYEQIKHLASEARTHPAVAQLVDQVTGVTDLARTGVASGLNAGADGLRSATDSPQAHTG